MVKTRHLTTQLGQVCDDEICEVFASKKECTWQHTWAGVGVGESVTSGVQYLVTTFHAGGSTLFLERPQSPTNMHKGSHKNQSELCGRNYKNICAPY